MRNEVLRGEHICVSDRNVNLLSDLNFDLNEGEILGVCGLRDSGKTTLIDVMTGRRKMTQGALYYHGRKITGKELSEEKVVVDIRKQSKLIPDLTVYDNMTLLSPMPLFPDMAKAKWTREIREIFHALDLSFDLNRKVRHLSRAEHYFLEICRGILNHVSVFVITDITYDCSIDEYRKLREILRILRKRGASILYIESVIDRLLGWTDRILVMREGRDVFVFDRKSQSRENLLKALGVTDPMEMQIPDRAGSAAKTEMPDEAVFSLSNFMFDEVRCEELVVHRGEIAGFVHENTKPPEELMRLFRGEALIHSGKAVINGQTADFRRGIESLISMGMGIFDGNREDGFYNQSVLHNILISSYPYVSGFLVSRREEETLAEEALSMAGIRMQDAGKMFSDLSHFEREKILFEKWALTRPAVLFIDNPFRFMDIRLLEWFRVYLTQLRMENVAVLYTMPYDRQYTSMADSLYGFIGNRLISIRDS